MYFMVCTNMLYTRGVDCFCTVPKGLLPVPKGSLPVPKGSLPVPKGLLPVESWHITSKRAMFAKGVDYFCNNDKLNVKSTKNKSPL